MKMKSFRFAAVAAVLLTFCLVFMAPVGADASVSTLEDFISNVTQGGTVTLLNDITVTTANDLNDITRDQAIEITKDVTIVLNGHTLTSNVVNNRTFWIVKDRVTFTIDGTVGNSKIEIPDYTSYGIVEIKADNVSLIVNGGTYTGTINDGTLFRGKGSAGVSYDDLVIRLTNANVDINGARVLLLYDSYAKEVAVIGGEYKTTMQAFAIAGSDISSPLTFTDVNVILNGDKSPLIEIAGMTAVFNNCEFSSNAANGIGTAPPEVIAISCNSQVTLNSGSYISTVVKSPVIGIYTSGGSITLENGVVLVSPTSVIEVHNADNDGYTDDEYSIDIKDAKITGTPLITHPKGNEEYTDISITGGTFSSDVSDYVADTYKSIKKSENQYIVAQPDYTITLSEITIPNFTEGETPSEVEVTVTNIGNLPVNVTTVTFDQEGILENGTLPGQIDGFGGTGKFTLKPLSTLTADTYIVKVTVQTDKDSSVFKSVTFTVNEKAVVPTPEDPPKKPTTSKPTSKPTTPTEPETPVVPETPEAGEATVETEVTDGGEVELETPTEGGAVAADDDAKITGVVLPQGTDSEVTFVPVSEQAAPAGKETSTKKVFEINVPTYEKGKPATIKFTMTVAELEADGKTAAEVALWHFDEETGEWTKLVTSYTIVDGIVYFEAITYDFSPFAIIYEETPVDETVEEPETPATPAPILAVLAGLGAAVVLRRK